MRKRKSFNAVETDRLTRFKMRKSGKNWIIIGTTWLRFLNFTKLFRSSTVKVDEVQLDAPSSDSRLLLWKSIAAGASIIAGGATLTNGTTNVQADEYVGNEKSIDTASNTTQQDSFTIAETTNTTESNTSAVESTSTSDNQVSTSVIQSVSTSESESTSLSTSVSTSSSLHTSESVSLSESLSTSLSSVSQSAENSTLESTATQSTSISSATVASETNSASSATTSNFKQQFEDKVAQADTFMQSEAFKSADAQLTDAYRTAIDNFKNLISSKVTLTEADYQYGVEQLTLIEQQITENGMVQPVVLASNYTDRSSVGSLTKGELDLSGASVYQDMGNLNSDLRKGVTDGKGYWGGLATTEYGQKKSVVVEVHQDENNPNKKYWTITYMPDGAFWNHEGTDIRNGSFNHKGNSTRFGFALSKDLSIVGDVKFTNYVYDDNNDNQSVVKKSDGSAEVQGTGKKVLDTVWNISTDNGKMSIKNDSGTEITKPLYSNRDEWTKAFNRYKNIGSSFSHQESLAIGDIRYLANSSEVTSHFFMEDGNEGVSPRVGSWAAKQTTSSSGQGMFTSNMSSKRQLFPYKD